ncbi:hypothetical protein ODJ79_32415 [Actinoplanes sp. KI2]|uniref:hypothetical protein n=1 Tax=Actinoplanes sp. KI2 TaxID=2983315 RepID=UPI0021D61186|nr:hypothetical protein [Actinoplanes sp. KI2]MCU7728439.1 hypothetical protein [Actinoplanes sp. KI2]
MTTTTLHLSSGQMHIDNLDQQGRAVLERRHAALRRRGQRGLLLKEITGPYSQRWHDQLADATTSLGDRRAAVKQISDHYQQDYAAMVKEVEDKLIKVAAPGGVPAAPPPVPQLDASRVAKLNAYYRDSVWIGPGTVLEDDFNLQGVAAWQHQLGVTGVGDDDARAETIAVNWLMKFTAQESRTYHFYPTTAEFGTIWVWSDTGINPDAEARLRITVRANVSPGGTPGSSVSAQRFNNDNHNEFDDFGTPGGNPNDQLHVAEYLWAGQTAIVMFTHEFYLYASGTGAGTHVYFDAPDQGLGPVWCYVF